MEKKSLSHYLKVPLLSSAASATLSLLVYPIDLINTMAKVTPTQRHAKDIIKEVLHKQGPLGFYRGGSLILWELFPSNVIYFFSYDLLNKSCVDFFDRHRIRSKWLIPMATSFLSELSCLFIYVPMDTILTRMQSHSAAYQYRSIWHGMKSIYQNEGILRFYYSSHLAIVYCLVMTTIQFTNYEWFKTMYQRRTGKHEFGTAQSILGTLYSTSIAVLLSNPIDTLVIQHQMTDFDKNQEATTWSLLKEEYRQRGLRLFTRNIGLRLMSLNAFGLATIPIYEYLRQRFGVDVEF